MRERQVVMALALAVAAMMGGAVVWGQEAGGGGRGMMPARPVPPVGWTYRWVSPAYETVLDRVWVAGRTEMVSEWVEISPGRLEQVWRQVVTPGHWETRTRQVMVRAGYWELVRIEPPVVVPGPVMVMARGVGTVGVEGYKAEGGEDLSRFSPLREWPGGK